MKRAFLVFLVLLFIIASNSILAQAMPLDFSFYSTPQSDGSMTVATISYNWLPQLSTTLDFSLEDLRYDYDLEGVTDSLIVNYATNLRLNIYGLEWDTGIGRIIVGALWNNQEIWEKGFFVFNSATYQFQELRNFNLFAPRIGWKGFFKLGDSITLRSEIQLSPLFLVLMDQFLYYDVAGSQDFTLNQGDGTGILGSDASASVSLFDWLQFQGSFSLYEFTLQELELGLGSFSEFIDFFQVKETKYSRLSLTGGLSVLIPIHTGMLKVGGSLTQRYYTSSSGNSDYETLSYGFLIGFDLR